MPGQEVVEISPGRGADGKDQQQQQGEGPF
jgi:hypothetical protein